MRFNTDPIPSLPKVTMRIPGVWSEPREFFENLPRGCRCTDDRLILADGSQFELRVLPSDDEFPRIFASSCPKLPTEDERDRIENFKVNVCLTGPGGSIEAARRLMAGAASVLAAGGAGVFVDNSGIAHGASDWITLFDSADDGGVYWAFITAVRGDKTTYSLGMHVLGFRDANIPSTGNAEYDARALHSFLGYTAFSGATIQDGELVDDPVLPTFRVYGQADDQVPSDAPMYNPYGRWRLETVQVEQN